MPFAFARKAKSSGPGRTTLRPRSWLRVAFGNRKRRAGKERAAAPAPALLGDFEIIAVALFCVFHSTSDDDGSATIMGRSRPGVRGAICFTAHPPVRACPTDTGAAAAAGGGEERDRFTDHGGAMIGRPAAFQLAVKEWSVRKNVRRSRHAIRARSRRP